MLNNTFKVSKLTSSPFLSVVLNIYREVQGLITVHIIVFIVYTNLTNDEVPILWQC